VVGWRVSELPLADSLCLRVIESGEPIIVHDTHDEPRFASSRLVKSGPKFRFYAGYPIRAADGLLIGTFCVFDVKPRKPDPALMETLIDLGQLAEREVVTADLWDAQSQLVVKLGEARRQALLDTLTRVWNRRGGTELLEMMLERSKKSFEQFSLCVIDIDRFKEINDENGHAIGDQVLRKTASSIVSSVRPEDIVSRYGGDEFLVILRDAGVDIARLVASRIRTNLARAALPLRAGNVNVTLSIGIAVNDPAEAITAEQMIDRADQALFHTKRNGRDGVTLYPDDIT
jgi:diguanylate cyclase (GGDEF)-like protein